MAFFGFPGSFAETVKGVFQAYNPRLYKLYSDVAEVILQNDESLSPPFPNSPFASTTINFGPHTVGYDHVDAQNLPFGWCVIDVFGKFDPKKGGHLVLWDLGITIEFPPGAAIFIPSALLVHSNAEIFQGEERYSMTSYSAGGLFRWVWNGCQTEEDLLEDLSAEEVVRHKAERASRWAECVDYFPLWKL